MEIGRQIASNQADKCRFCDKTLDGHGERLLLSQYHQKQLLDLTGISVSEIFCCHNDFV